jgi:hypothetical protein
MLGNRRGYEVSNSYKLAALCTPADFHLSSAGFDMSSTLYIFGSMAHSLLGAKPNQGMGFFKYELFILMSEKSIHPGKANEGNGHTTGRLLHLALLRVRLKIVQSRAKASRFYPSALSLFEWY